MKSLLGKVVWRRTVHSVKIVRGCVKNSWTRVHIRQEVSRTKVDNHYMRRDFLLRKVDCHYIGRGCVQKNWSPLYLNRFLEVCRYVPPDGMPFRSVVLSSTAWASADLIADWNLSALFLDKWEHRTMWYLWWKLAGWIVGPKWQLHKDVPI